MLLSSKVDYISEVPFYKIQEESKAFASYSKGLVYIGNEKYLASVKDEVEDKDVLVLDERNRTDPNMKIVSSYQVCNRQDKKEIIRILEAYEYENPSTWDRSYDSMLTEWEVHNLLHGLGYKLSRTTDVDFNNADENTYNDNIWDMVLRKR